MSINGWIVIDGLAAWLASSIMGTSERQVCITNIVLGIAGAFAGGIIWGMISGDDFVADFRPGTFLITTPAAVILLAIARARSGGRP